MKSSAIERIIKSDRRARETVASAELYRDASARSLEEKKAQIEQRFREELEGDAEEALEKEMRAATGITEERRRVAEETVRRMDELYRRRRDEWIAQYTARVIGTRREE